MAAQRLGGGPHLRVVKPSRRRGRRPVDPRSLLAALVVVSLAAVALVFGLEVDERGESLSPSPNAQSESESIVAPASIRITDGDTFRIGDERIRVENIDTPEVNGACARERDLAEKATREAIRLLKGGAPVRVRRSDIDEYGRTLALVSVNGRDYGDHMVAAGLARRWNSPEVDWCAGLQ